MRTRFRLLTAVVAVATGASAALVAAPGAGARVRHGAAKDPIVIGAIGPFTDPSTGTETPEWPQAVRARAKAINKSGGIDGQKVEVFECNTQLDPNLTEKCVRDAAAAGVVASVGWNGTTGSNLFPLLEENGIAAIGSVPVSPTEVTSKVSFPFTAGVPGAFEALPLVLKDEGADKQSLVVTDLGAAAAAALLFVNDTVEREGIDLPEDRQIKAAPDTSDFAPLVASATEGDPDGITVFLVGPAAATFLQQLKQGGYEGTIASGSPFLTPPVLEALGDTGDGIIVVSLLSWQKGKNAKLFAKDMNTYAKKAARTDITANYWLSTWVFEQVAKQIVDGGGTVDKTTVLDAMNNLSDLDTGGMTPTLDFTKDSTITKPLPLARLFNPTVTLFEIKDGKLVQTSRKFVNGFE